LNYTAFQIEILNSYITAFKGSAFTKIFPNYLYNHAGLNNYSINKEKEIKIYSKEGVEKDTVSPVIHKGMYPLIPIPSPSRGCTPSSPSLLSQGDVPPHPHPFSLKGRREYTLMVH